MTMETLEQPNPFAGIPREEAKRLMQMIPMAIELRKSGHAAAMKIPTKLAALAEAAEALVAVVNQFRRDPLEPWLATHESFAHFCCHRWKMSMKDVSMIEAGKGLKPVLSAVLRGTFPAPRGKPEPVAHCPTCGHRIKTP